MKKLIRKWCEIPDSVKSTVAFVVSSFVLKGINFITTPIFTRVMDASQYGVLSTYNSWLFIIEVFALLSMTSAGVFNVGLNDYKDRRDEYISSVLFLCNIVTIVVFTLLLSAQWVMGTDFLLPTNQLVLMFFWLIFSPARIFWITRKKYEYKYKLAFFVTIFSTIFSQGAALLAVKSFGGENPAEIKLWSQNVVSMMFTLPIYVYIFAKGRKAIDVGCWKYVLVFALPLIPHYLAQHVMSSADRIMIAEIVSSADAGIYSVVNNIGLVANIVWGAINASLVAYTFESLNKNEHNGINRVVTMLLIGYAVVCLGIALIAPDVMKILAPEEYYKGVYAVPPVICVAFLSALYNIYANIEFYHKKAIYIATSTIVAAIVNIVLNFLLIPAFSFNGAAYTTLISYVVLIMMHYLGYRRCQKKLIYNDRNIILIAVFCVVSCISCSFLYGNSNVRYILIACIAVVLVWKHKIVFEIIKKLKK